MQETAGVLKENIINKRDFVHLDTQLEQKPVASTAALSRIICFITNKTSEYLDNISPNEKHKMIVTAIQEASRGKAA